MEDGIKEFVNLDGSIISSKIPNIDPKTSAKTTTDKSVRMRTQPYNWTIYNVKLQEKELPYSNEANKMAKDPESFHKFLESVGESEKFEEEKFLVIIKLKIDNIEYTIAFQKE